MSTIKYGASRQSVLRTGYALSDDQIQSVAPSVFAQSAHDSRAERYSFIPTSQVLTGLRNEGFEVFEARQTQVRVADKRDFTKHLLRLRRRDAIQSQSETPEIILVNSHDGTSSYQLMAGVFRMVCSNGLIAGDIANDIRIRHSGNVVNDVIEGSFRVIEDAIMVGDRIEQYKAIQLAQQEQEVFANAALQLRWEEGQAPVLASSVLRANRWDDRKSDLWTTFNRIQENLVKGGVAGRGATGKRMTTRAVGGVNENVKLNKALWSLADGLAQIKSGVVALEEVAE